MALEFRFKLFQSKFHQFIVAALTGFAQTTNAFVRMKLNKYPIAFGCDFDFNDVQPPPSGMTPTESP